MRVEVEPGGVDERDEETYEQRRTRSLEANPRRLAAIMAAMAGED